MRTDKALVGGGGKTRRWAVVGKGVIAESDRQFITLSEMLNELFTVSAMLGPQCCSMPHSAFCRFCEYCHQSYLSSYIRPE